MIAQSSNGYAVFELRTMPGKIGYVRAPAATDLGGRLTVSAGGGLPANPTLVVPLSSVPRAASRARSLAPVTGPTLTELSTACRTFSLSTYWHPLCSPLIEGPTRQVYLSSSMHHVRTYLEEPLWRQRRWNGAQAYSESKFLVTALAFAVADCRPAVFCNAVVLGWVPTRMGSKGAPDDLRTRRFNAGCTRDWQEGPGKRLGRVSPPSSAA